MDRLPQTDRSLAEWHDSLTCWVACVTRTKLSRMRVGLVPLTCHSYGPRGLVEVEFVWSSKIVGVESLSEGGRGPLGFFGKTQIQ